jgi:hypothetical protein
MQKPTMKKCPHCKFRFVMVGGMKMREHIENCEAEEIWQPIDHGKSKHKGWKKGRR